MQRLQYFFFFVFCLIDFNKTKINYFFFNEKRDAQHNGVCNGMRSNDYIIKHLSFFFLSKFNASFFKYFFFHAISDN